MNDLLTRRRVVTGLGLLSLGLIAGCDPGSGLSYKYGKDLSNEILGRKFKLRDAQGNEMMLGSFRGMMPMIFFGFTQCPAVCPTALARAAQAKKMMGPDGDRLQVVFITLDPERDKPAMLDAYVKAFDPSFIALSGTLKKPRPRPRNSRCFTRKSRPAIRTPCRTPRPVSCSIPWCVAPWPVAFAVRQAVCRRPADSDVSLLILCPLE